MNISIVGSGKTIVFLHGFCENKSIWEAFEAKFKSTYQVVLIDLPGHGASPVGDDNIQLEDVATDIHLLLVKHDIHEYFVIGHSLGGYIGLAIAELFPNHFLGLGLFHSSTFADDEEKKKVRAKVGDFINEHGVASFTKNAIPNLFANKEKHALAIQEMITIASKTSPEAVIGFSLAMMNRPDRTKVIATSIHPVFIIGGELDKAVPLDVSQQMIQNINVGAGIILANTGHNGFVEAEQESLSFIGDFFGKYF